MLTSTALTELHICTQWAYVWTHGDRSTHDFLFHDFLFPSLFTSPPVRPTHLFEHQRALPRSDGLRQLGNAALVEVRPREAAVVDKDFGAAVAAVG